jgi:hypothetical protein
VNMKVQLFHAPKILSILTAEQILVNHMKKAKEDHVSAVNGLEAVEIYQAAPRTSKVIFMGMTRALIPIYGS